MRFLSRHWPTLAVLLVALVYVTHTQANRIPDLKAEVRAHKAAAEEAESASSRWRVIALQAGADVDAWKDSTAAAEARARDADRSAASAATVIANLPDTAMVGDVRPAIDSAMSEMRRARDHWREAFIARGAELDATQRQLHATEQERDAQQRRAESLQRAVAALEEQLRGASPWLSAAALTAGGAGIGYLAGGPQGAAVGAAGGFAVAVVWHGLDDLFGL